MSCFSVLLLIMAAFAVGAVLIALAQLHPATREKAKDVWPLYASEFLIVGAILIPAALGGFWLIFAGIIFVWRGIYEMFRLFEAKLMAALPLALMLGALPLLFTIATLSVLMPLSFLAVGIALIFVMAVDFRNVGTAQVLAAGIAIFYPILAMALTLALLGLPKGFLWLVFVYATVEVNDAFALLFGKLFGKRRILPRLSPGKTEAGLIGGLATGMAAGFALARYMLGLSQNEAIIATILALAAGLAGDLLTSALKRWRGKKDFAPLLKRHGGILDIYDSVLFAAPTILLWRLLAA